MAECFRIWIDRDFHSRGRSTSADSRVRRPPCASPGGILNIAEDTVNKHIASAMRKLNVYSRAQAVAESIRRGEIIP